MKIKKKKYIKFVHLLRRKKDKLLIRKKKKLSKFRYETVFLLVRILVLITNLIYFIINIYILCSTFNKFSNNHISNNEIIKFINNSTIIKNIDKYTLTLLANSYEKIGNYLNNKYNINNNSSNLSIPINKTEKKKTIRIHAVNLCSREEFERTLLWYLKDTFIVQFDDVNPDYLIYNVFGYNEKNPKYDNIIKIALFTENTIPDLFNCDYALGHAHISYLDRYFMLPFCFLRKLNKTKDLNLEKIRKEVIKKPRRKKFCVAAISQISTIYSDLFRLKFIEELNKYKKVDMGGKYKNNVGGPIKDKIEFFKDYKFSIAMENTNGDGYASEKIIDSFISGTIPIYYGNYMIEEYINPKSFILIKGPEDMKEKIEYIKKIDNDDELYRSILKEKVLIDDNIVEKMTKEQSDFWIHIFNQDIKKAKRNTFS